MREMRAVELDRAGEACAESGARSPAECRLDLVTTQVAVADVNQLLFRREGYGLHCAAPGERDQLRRHFSQTDRLMAAEIEYLTLRALARARQQQRLDHVIHVIEIAPLSALAV